MTWNQRNPEKNRAAQKAWRIRNRDRIRSYNNRPEIKAARRARFKRYYRQNYARIFAQTHGLADVESVQQAMSQICCAICGGEEKKMVIDHDHNWRVVRDKLCNSCNLGLAYFKESPRRLDSAIAYIRRHIKKARRQAGLE